MKNPGPIPGGAAKLSTAPANSAATVANNRLPRSRIALIAAAGFVYRRRRSDTLQREHAANLLQERCHAFSRIARAQCFEREHSTISAPIDDRLDPAQVGGRLLRPIIDALFDLPGDGIRKQLRD